MSKAIIVKHEGKGQYLVDVIYDAAYIQKIIDRLNADYAQLQFKDLVKALDAKAAQQSKVDDAAQTVYDAINVYNSDPTEVNLKKVATVTEAAFKVSEDYEVAVIQLDFVKSRLDSLRRRISLLSNFLTDKVRRLIWCIDLADGKKDRKIFYPGNEVGMAEISGDEKLGQNLLASYTDTWKYLTTRDGNLMNIAGMSHFEVFYNLAIFPGWQKWRHRYRTGKITGGDPTAGWTVDLDPMHSSEQQIQINNIGTALTGIHAQYMNCDDDAFAVKDHVVLDVVISGAPPGFLAATIIGFVDHPKPCSEAEFVFYGTTSALSRFEELRRPSGAWMLKVPYKSDLTQAWTGGRVRHWFGRDVDNEPIILEFLEPVTNPTVIYLSGKKIADLPTDHGWIVLGAAMTPDKKYLYCVAGYFSSGNHIALMRKQLQTGSTGEGTTETGRSVYLGAILKAQSSVDGIISINADATLYGTAKAKAEVIATLDVIHGWDVYDLDLGAYANAVTVSDMANAFHFNESCTQALAMWKYTHGVFRSPQSAPAQGAVWDDRNSYTRYRNYWREKLELNLGNISAKNFADVQINFVNHGRQGALLRQFTEQTSGSCSFELVHYLNNFGQPQTRCDLIEEDWTLNIDETYSGSYQSDTGFDGDTEVVGSHVAIGGEHQFEHYHAGGQTGHVEETTFSREISILYRLGGVDIPLSYTCGVGPVKQFISYPDYSVDLSKGFIVVNGVGANPTMVYEQGFLVCGGAMLDSTIIQTASGPGGSDACSTSCSDSCGLGSTNCTQTPVGETCPATSSSSSSDILYDITEHKGWVYGGSPDSDSIVMHHTYDAYDAAVTPNGRIMAFWKDTRSPGFAVRRGSFLTAGDLGALDGLDSDAEYYAIHPT